ncbi:MAG: hypothetical protein ISR82_00715 [Candidatus Marinimicrobia bacterium]|nr:hypothetical protein [Candidatus Neomarinimicrobiota bacterium]MBL7009726.1 hypothetical protein [Candidatus Neomarinimicrobiota bacterium]MBL7029870.1 hypothetical protein [Candidatus Neomarinimicrobiota bacterium]
MLAEKYFPIESGRYGRLSNLAKKLDGFFTLKPERWFGIWAMVLAGANVAQHIQDRWFYWDWSTFSFLFMAILIFSIGWDRFIQKFPIFPKKIDSIKSGIFTLVIGFTLFLLGTIPQRFNVDVFSFGLPYFLFFLVGHMTYSIPILVKENGKKQSPNKGEMAPILAIIIGLTSLSVLAGVIHDDPMISTIAAVYSPFPIVALLFPSAVRHLQRCRMYVVFTPAMFLGVRFPWFLILILLLFWILRHYHYFRHGEVKPSFKVDLPTDYSD